jgi:outer membrane protein insertion porin family
VGTRIAFALLVLASGVTARAAQARAQRGAAFAQSDARRSPAAPGEPSESPPKVRSVELHLPPGTDVGDLAREVAIRPSAPLSRRDVRRTLELLFHTGRFSDIAVWEAPAGEGQVDIIVEAQTRTYVERLDFEGNRALSFEALRKAADLSQGRVEVYSELVEKVIARLKEAYGHKGLRDVEITPSVLTGERGDTALSFDIREGEATKVVSVSAAGDPQLPPEEILKTLGISPGQALDLDRIDRGVDALRARYRAEGYWRARLGTPKVAMAPEGAAVLLPISAGPKMEFRFEGNRSFDEKTLRQVMAYDGEEVLDAPLLGQIEERIARFYRLMGFADASVRSRDARSGDRRRSIVVFFVDEGEPLRVVGVSFSGNRHFSESFLRERIREALLEAAPVVQGAGAEAADSMLTGGPRRGSAPYVADPNSVYAEWVYNLALARILELYRADGFLSAQIEPPTVDRDERRREAQVLVRIREGPQTRIASVEVEGAPDAAAARRAVGLRVGSPLNSLDVETSRQAVRRAMGQAGYLFAKVEDEKQLSGDGTSARVVFRVRAGLQVRVGRILIEGQNRTAEDLVRSALSVREGGVLDPEQLAQSQRNLLRLGIFKVASLRLSAPDVEEEVKDLYVTLEERPTQQYSAGLGYSLFDGPRASLEYSKINLFGRGLQLQARAKVSYTNLSYWVLTGESERPEKESDALGRRVNLSLIYPRFLALLPTEVGTRWELVHERINRPTYGFERTGTVLGADLAAPRIFTASLQYDIEKDTINKDPNVAGSTSFSDTERLRFLQGWIFLHSVRQTVGIDLRDDSINPHRGLFLGGSAQVAQCLDGSVLKQGSTNTYEKPFCLFLKATAQAAFYAPLPGGVVLALQLKAGKIFPLDAAQSSQTPPPLRFFLGGTTSMRGWLEDGMVSADVREKAHSDAGQCSATLNRTGCTQLGSNALDGKVKTEGGELFTLGRAELRFPVAGPVEGALFLDAGSLWLDPKNFAWKRLRYALRYATGLSLRLGTPIGPAALDLAFKPDYDPALGEGWFTPQFSIGMF